MATTLRRLRLKRVSLVDRPANEQARVVLFKSELGGEDRGDLSDDDFAAVWTDAEGRKQRKLPIPDAAHVRNALARFNQTEMPADVKAKARAKLERAKERFGIGKEADMDLDKGQQPSADAVDVPAFARCKKCDMEMEKGAKACKGCGAEMEPDEDDMMKAAGGPKEGDVDEKLKADLDAANAKIEALTKERDELKKKADTPEEIEKRKLESLPESVRKQLVEQAEEIAKMRSEKSEAEEIQKARAEMPNVPGKPEDVGRLLKRFKDVAKAEDYEALVTILKAASAQIEKGGLFREAGRSGDGDPQSPAAEVARLANEHIAKSKDMTLADAYAAVFRERPDLYAAYARSVSVGANADRD